MEEKIHGELESPHTSKTNKFFISGNLSSSSYLRSSQKHHVPLPSFFTPTTTYVLLKNPQEPLPSTFSKTPHFDLLGMDVDGCLRRMKQNNDNIFTELESLRLEFYVDYNSQVSKTWVIHGTWAFKAKDTNFLNSFKNVPTN